SAIGAAFGTATATDACGTVTITSADGPVTGSCTQSQTRTFTATDACGNTATASSTVSWTSDLNPPTITVTAAGTLGCNPSSAAIAAAFGSATAKDACGSFTMTSADGPVTGSCTQSQTRTFTATDACGNTATASSTVSWTSDLNPPTINVTDAETLGW